MWLYLHEHHALVHINQLHVFTKVQLAPWSEFATAPWLIRSLALSLPGPFTL